jgi:hypothetical protein
VIPCPFVGHAIGVVAVAVASLSAVRAIVHGIPLLLLRPPSRLKFGISPLLRSVGPVFAIRPFAYPLSYDGTSASARHRFVPEPANFPRREAREQRPSASRTSPNIRLNRDPRHKRRCGLVCLWWRWRFRLHLFLCN